MSAPPTPPGCAEVRAAAVVLLSLPPNDPERAAADKHAATCPECAAALRDGASVWRLLDSNVGGAGALEGPSEPALRKASQAVLAEFDSAPSLSLPDRALIAAAVLAGGGLLWAFERRTIAGLSSLTELVMPVVLAALAARLVMLCSERPRLALGALLTLSALILVGDLGAPVGAVEAAGCMGLELLAALVPLATAAVVVGRRPGAGPIVYATAASAGAIVAEASLHLLCPHHTLAHIAVVHFGGVLVATMIGALAGVALRPAAASAA